MPTPIGEVQKISDNCFASRGLVSISSPALTSNRDHPAGGLNNCRIFLDFITNGGLTSRKLPLVRRGGPENVS
jgi:hypothetical protein